MNDSDDEDDFEDDKDDHDAANDISADDSSFLYQFIRTWVNRVAWVGFRN